MKTIRLLNLLCLMFVDDSLVLAYTPQPLPLQFYNTGYDVKAGELIIKVVNAAEIPQKIYPQESVYNHFGKAADYKFPPYSYTIMRIKATMADTDSK